MKKIISFVTALTFISFNVLPGLDNKKKNEKIQKIKKALNQNQKKKKKKDPRKDIIKMLLSHSSAVHYAIEKNNLRSIRDLFKDLNSNDAYIILSTPSSDGGNLFHYAAAGQNPHNFLTLLYAAKKCDLSNQQISTLTNQLDNYGATAGTWFVQNNLENNQDETEANEFIKSITTDVKKQYSISLQLKQKFAKNIFLSNYHAQIKCICDICKLKKIQKSKANANQKLDEMIDVVQNSLLKK